MSFILLLLLDLLFSHRIIRYSLHESGLIIIILLLLLMLMGAVLSCCEHEIITFGSIKFCKFLLLVKPGVASRGELVLKDA
jgi:hypothetical protein